MQEPVHRRQAFRKPPVRRRHRQRHHPLRAPLPAAAPAPASSPSGAPTSKQPRVMPARQHLGEGFEHPRRPLRRMRLADPPEEEPPRRDAEPRAERRPRGVRHPPDPARRPPDWAARASASPAPPPRPRRCHFQAHHRLSRQCASISAPPALASKRAKTLVSTTRTPGAFSARMQRRLARVRIAGPVDVHDLRLPPRRRRDLPRPEDRDPRLPVGALPRPPLGMRQHRHLRAQRLQPQRQVLRRALGPAHSHAGHDGQNAHFDGPSWFGAD